MEHSAYEMSQSPNLLRFLQNSGERIANTSKIKSQTLKEIGAKMVCPELYLGGEGSRPCKGLTKSTPIRPRLWEKLAIVCRSIINENRLEIDVICSVQIEGSGGGEG